MSEETKNSQEEEAIGKTYDFRVARRLVGYMPEGMDKVFFVSGGSEAVESCLKLARQWAVATGQGQRCKVISRFPAYHGSTFGALAVTGYDALTKPFLPMMQVMPKIPAPTAYLDRDNLSMEQRGIRYADMLEEKILAEGADSVLAFIMEPIGGASTGARSSGRRVGRRRPRVVWPLGAHARRCLLR